MDILARIDRILVDQTVAADVAVSTSGISPIMAKRKSVTSVSQGIKTIGYECPKGFEWDPKQRVCIPTKKVTESIMVVDYRATKKSGNELKKIVSKYSGKITDWMEEDYGVTAFVDIPNKKEKDFKMAISREKDFGLSESALVGGSYLAGDSLVAGSGQTRAVGDKENEIEVLKRNPRPLKYNKLLGAYLPGEENED